MVSECNFCGAHMIEKADGRAWCPLHAAAPAMLEALEQIAVWAENGACYDASKPLNRATQRNVVERLRLSADKARAAIAKARGESK